MMQIQNTKSDQSNINRVFRKNSRVMKLHHRNQLISPKAQRRGFTLIELLVVIAIIALLIGVLLPALGKARVCARAVREQSGMRQTMIAYTMYADDNRGGILLGHPDNALWQRMVQRGSEPRNFSGERLGQVVGSRYPWRLISYFDGNFEGLYQDRRVIELLAVQIDAPTASGSNEAMEYVISAYPSFGLNTYFMGGGAPGDNIAFTAQGRRIFGKFYTSKLNDIRSTSTQMVFASSRDFPQVPPLNDVGILEGYFFVKPPHVYSTNGRLWGEHYVEHSQTPGNDSGFVSLRYNGKGIAGMLDGHAEQWGWEEFNDMRNWSDKATSADWSVQARLP